MENSILNRRPRLKQGLGDRLSALSVKIVVLTLCAFFFGCFQAGHIRADVIAKDIIVLTYLMNSLIPKGMQ